ncbi:hypothetical protein, partial [Escherichia coli]
MDCRTKKKKNRHSRWAETQAH